MSIKIEGIDNLLAVLKRVPGLMDRAIESSLTKEAFDIMAESQRVVPRDTGRLRASKAVDVSRSARGWTATLGYGGDAAEYAAYIHEVGEAGWNWNVAGTFTPSPSGGSGNKYLEGPVMAARKDLGRNMGRTIEQVVKRALG